jgi:hypothetical protein
MSGPVEVYREEAGGCYMPAKGKGLPCYHVHVAGQWWELYDFDGVRPVVAVDYGPTANREALGRRMASYEVPERILARIGALEP